MFRRLWTSARPDRGIAQALYGASVAQARQPSFYTAFGVPDSVAGRFEMIVLHLVLVLRRLETAGDRGLAVRQELFDLFCSDMDRSLREMGVGDLSVPKRTRKMVQSAYGRIAAYGAGLAAADAALDDAVARNVFPDIDNPPAAAPLAAYMRAGAKALASQPVSGLMAGTIAWPEPILAEAAA